jgi:hypothetical protein
LFAPKRLYKGEKIQDFLQRHFIKCYVHLARFVLYSFLQRKKT